MRRAVWRKPLLGERRKLAVDNLKRFCGYAGLLLQNCQHFTCEDITFYEPMHRMVIVPESYSVFGEVLVPAILTRKNLDEIAVILVQ